MSEEEATKWLCDELGASITEDLTMGELEKLIDQRTLEIRRRALERLTQARADLEAFGCPQCGRCLGVIAYGRERAVESVFGQIRFRRSYGWCMHCRRHCYPSDVGLGLNARAQASPRVQEICALSVLSGPAGREEDDVRRLTGVRISASTLHREARRQGERALEIRERDMWLSERPDGVSALAGRAPKLPQRSTLVIEIDAWNIRERDHWGKTDERRKAGEDVGRWHWVYTGTVFRLDQRGTLGKGRQVIAERGYVATRQGIESFRKQLYAEALQRGLLQAKTVLVLADGAVWIWNLATEQFKKARQRVDMFHVKQHLWDLAAELHGKGTPEAKQWVRPYLQWLDRRKDAAMNVIESLEDLQQTLAESDEAAQKAVLKELAYLKQHKDRMDYKTAKKLGQPCGSGAIESTCSQYQRRFKLTGQFWSLDGDEALLALATLHRNQRWELLFPHDQNLN